eukprot:2718131-Pleurochrysis_carterae.AAC.1
MAARGSTAFSAAQLEDACEAGGALSLLRCRLLLRSLRGIVAEDSLPLPALLALPPVPPPAPPVLPALLPPPPPPPLPLLSPKAPLQNLPVSPEPNARARSRSPIARRSSTPRPSSPPRTCPVA